MSFCFLYNVVSENYSVQNSPWGGGGSIVSSRSINTDNDNSFSLFDCLLNVLILTFSVCGISYHRWTTAMDFTYRVPLYIYNMSYVL